MTRFKKISVPRLRLADEAYRQIIEAIHRGDIDPAKRIVQEKLASELEISRTPVREALLRLEQEGILELSGRGGFNVRQITPDEVNKIYQTRVAIEGHAARLLTERGDAIAYEQIDAIITKQETRSLNSTLAYYDANKRIHRAFVERTDNKFLLDMFDQLWNRGLSLHLFATFSTDELGASLGDHHQLCTIMQAGDPEMAAAAMRSHIEDGLQLQLTALKQN
jgi:DNA-binding GntR family transcriptional regulator